MQKFREFSCSDYDYGIYTICDIKNKMGSSSWWKDYQMEFIRKPSEQDLEILIEVLI